MPIGNYAVTDQKYRNMTGSVSVSGSEKASSNNYVMGGFYSFQHPYWQNTGQIYWLKNTHTSTYDFISKTVQKDINGPTTLIIYSTTLPIQVATANSNLS